MSWTKRQFILKAFSKAGLASYAYDLTPAQLQNALTDLDAMMATWEDMGIAISWPFTDEPEDADLDTETNASNGANEAIYLNLAVRIAPDFGKILSNDTQKVARHTFTRLLGQYVKPTSKDLPTTLPKGAGNKPWRYANDPFIDPPA